MAEALRERGGVPRGLVYALVVPLLLNERYYTYSGYTYRGIPHGAPARYRYGRRPAGRITCQTYSPWRQMNFKGSPWRQASVAPSPWFQTKLRAGMVRFGAGGAATMPPRALRSSAIRMNPTTPLIFRPSSDFRNSFVLVNVGLELLAEALYAGDRRLLGRAGVCVPQRCGSQRDARLRDGCC